MKALSTAQLARKKFKRLGLPQPWKGVVGDITPEAQGLIHGPAGGGKSTFSLAFAALISLYGRVLYATPEERHGPTLVDRIRRLGLDAERFTKNLVIVDTASPIELAEAIDEIRPIAVFVDSQTSIDPGSEIAGVLAEWCRSVGIGLWMIAHQTKTGRFRGGSDLAHDPDMVLEVKDGLVTPGKNRYGGRDEMPVPFTADELAAVMPRRNPNMAVECAAPQSARCKAMFARLSDGDSRKRSSSKRSSSKRSSSKSSSASKKKTATPKRSTTRKSKPTKKRTSAPKRTAKKSAPGPTATAKTKAAGSSKTSGVTDPKTQSAILDRLDRLTQTVEGLQ